MNFFAILKLIVQLMPIIHSAIDQIDDLFPQGGYGAEKLALLKTIVEKAIAVSDMAGPLGSSGFSILWPLISSTVSNLVSTKKAIKSLESNKPVEIPA